MDPGEKLFVEIVSLFGLSRKTTDEVEPREQFGLAAPPHAALFVDDTDRPENFIGLCLEVVHRDHCRISSLHTKCGNITGGVMPYDCPQCLTTLLLVLRDRRRVGVVYVQGL